MLHDVGKVACRAEVLRLAPGALTDDDLVTMAEHALSGVELVQDVDFLAGSVDGIAHHHERFDGLGYPAGLTARRSPSPPGIVAVADTFES